jgi:hypothetical protein
MKTESQNKREQQLDLQAQAYGGTQTPEAKSTRAVASDYTSQQLVYALFNGNRASRRLAKKLLRRKGVL